MDSTEIKAPCPAELLLKTLSGKWKPQIFLLATSSERLRFSSLMRQLDGVNKQSLASALREMEADGLLSKVVIREKPLHIEYYLTEKGNAFIPIFKQLESLL